MPLVTGGSKGIGRAMAEAFAAEGANVSICARNADEVDAAVAALEAQRRQGLRSRRSTSPTAALKHWVDAPRASSAASTRWSAT